ncbi:MAG: DegQ family serine endoprotease [Desulfobacteraceae bacterium]|nr:DegQ family serine endoprotease [Desulfobacteraceae bacterium]
MKFFRKPATWLTGIVAVALILAGGLILTPNNHATSAAGTRPEKTAGIPASFTELAEQAGPAVVNIRTVKTVEGGTQLFRHFFGPQGPQSQPDSRRHPFDEFFEHFFGQQAPPEFKQRSLGSGFILDKQGHIVTNNHVIENADKIRVKLKNGREYDAEIIGSDPNTDLALIKIETDDELPVLGFGDSDKIRIGEWVLAIGNPFGLDHTVTAGIISAKGRVIGAGPYDDFIQTDASINPGNSGGPLLNMKGEVIGINTAIVAGGTGIGFAIPSKMAGDIIEQLKDKGEVTRGWLGVGIQELNDEIKEYYGTEKGVLVTQVFDGDPAEKAGIEPNDIIVSVNGKKVDSPRELSRIIADIKPGEEAEIKLIRGGKTRTVDVTLAKRDEQKLAETGQQPEEPGATGLGITVSDVTEDIASQLNLRDAAGAVVTEVESGRKAAEAGFRRGDVIKEINHEPVNSSKDFREKVEKADKGDILQFYVIRPRTGITIIKLKK